MYVYMYGGWRNRLQVGSTYREAMSAETIQDEIDEREQKKIASEAIELMNTGFGMGKILYKDRGELHER